MADLGKISAKSDTQPGDGLLAAMALLADAGGGQTWVVELSAKPETGTGPVIMISKRASAAAGGGLVPGAVSVEIDIGLDLLAAFAAAASPTDKAIKLRETKGCDESGNAVYCLTLRSKWYAAALGTDFT